MRTISFFRKCIHKTASIHFGFRKILIYSIIVGIICGLIFQIKNYISASFKEITLADIYIQSSKPSIEDITSSFTKASGLTVKVYYQPIDSGSVINKVDIFISDNISDMLTLQRARLIEPIDLKNTTNHTVKSPLNLWHSFAESIKIPVYHGTITPQKINTILISNYSKRDQDYITKLSMEKGNTSLLKINPGSEEELINKLKQDENLVALLDMQNVANILSSNNTKGFHAVPISSNMQILTLTPDLVAISRNSPNKDKATTFLNFLFSKNGQQIIAKKSYPVTNNAEYSNNNINAVVSKNYIEQLRQKNFDENLFIQTTAN